MPNIGGRATGSIAVHSSIVMTDAGLQALTRKGADVDKAIGKLAIDTGGRAQMNIREVGAIDTSFMINTTRARQIGERLWSIGTAAYYGIFIEYGTRFMAARPWLTPAMNWARGQMDAVLRNALRL